jgi:LysR family transcriptional regulator, nod-box dependent transcriptional activator
MRLSGFDLNLLIALDAVLHLKNVTRAAEHIHVSQPAMSAALHRLREYFNDELLVRVGRDFELTPRGASLLEPVRNTLLHIQATLGTQPIFDPAATRRSFSVMLADQLLPWLSAQLLQRVVAEAPGVQLRFLARSRLGVDKLAAGDIDFLVTLDNPELLGLPAFPEWLARTELLRVQWVCVVSADHPAVREELTREQYLSLPHLYVRSSGEMLPTEDIVRRELGLRLDVRATTENVLEVPFMLPGTPLLAIMPETLATLLRPSLAIRVFPLPAGLTLQGRVMLFWHRRSEPDPGHAWMRRLIVDASRPP